MRPEGLGNLIKIIHLIGFRTRDLTVVLYHVKIINGDEIYTYINE
jgi:hypothetical protein